SMHRTTCRSSTASSSSASSTTRPCAARIASRRSRRSRRNADRPSAGVRHGMEPPVASLLAELLECTSFEDPARITLGALLRAADAALGSSLYAGRGRIVRGMVHLRPADGYRRLAIHEHGAEAVAPEAPSTSAYLPSSTAWRAVVEHDGPVSIDV